MVKNEDTKNNFSNKFELGLESDTDQMFQIEGVNNDEIDPDCLLHRFPLLGDGKINPIFSKLKEEEYVAIEATLLRLLY